MANPKGIIVVVSNGRYDMFGDNSPHSRKLARLLQMMGGISDTVAPGRYEFTAKIRWFKVVTHLRPLD